MSYHSTTFGGNRQCGGGNVMGFVCHENHYNHYVSPPYKVWWQ